MTSERDRSPEARDQNEAASPIWDRGQALDALGGNEDLLREVAGMLAEEVLPLLAALDEAVAAADAEALEHNAHRLKGAVAIFAAAPAVEAAFALETIGRERRMAEAAAARDSTRTRIDELLDALRLVR